MEKITKYKHNNNKLIQYVIDAGCNLYLDIYKYCKKNLYINKMSNFQQHILQKYLYNDHNFVFKNTCTPVGRPTYK